MSLFCSRNRHFCLCFVVDKIKNFLAEYYIDLDNGTKEFVYGRQLVRTS